MQNIQEWDCKKLQNAFGSGITNPDQVCAAVHKKYNAVHAVIVRPNEFNDQNEPFIKNTLCRNADNYHKDRAHNISCYSSVQSERSQSDWFVHFQRTAFSECYYNLTNSMKGVH